MSGVRRESVSHCQSNGLFGFAGQSALCVERMCGCVCVLVYVWVLISNMPALFAFPCNDYFYYYYL